MTTQRTPGDRHLLMAAWLAGITLLGAGVGTTVDASAAVALDEPAAVAVDESMAASERESEPSEAVEVARAARESELRAMRTSAAGWTRGLSTSVRFR